MLVLSEGRRVLVRRAGTFAAPDVDSPLSRTFARAQKSKKRLGDAPRRAGRCRDTSRAWPSGRGGKAWGGPRARRDASLLATRGGRVLCRAKVRLTRQSTHEKLLLLHEFCRSDDGRILSSRRCAGAQALLLQPVNPREATSDIACTRCGGHDVARGEQPNWLHGALPLAPGPHVRARPMLRARPATRRSLGSRQPASRASL